jgi:hypothetical protein
MDLNLDVVTSILLGLAIGAFVSLAMYRSWRG